MDTPDIVINFIYLDWMQGFFLWSERICERDDCLDQREIKCNPD